MNKYEAKLYMAAVNIPEVIEWFEEELGRSKEALDHAAVLYDNFTTIFNHMTAQEEKIKEAMER